MIILKPEDKMSTYVDNAKNPYGRMLMSHCTSDTKEELLLMMKNIGVSLKWFQDSDNKRWHFDISQNKKDIAIRYYGAKEISTCKMIQIINEREYKK